MTVEDQKIRFLIISHVLHKSCNNQIWGYGPYVREMNIWLKNVDEVMIVAPIEEVQADSIDLAYQHPNIHFIPVPGFSINSVKNTISTICVMPKVILRTWKGMSWSNHIHLRCPGNSGLIGCVLQMFFPVLYYR